MTLAQAVPVEVVVRSSGTPLWLALLTLGISLLALIVSGLQYVSNRAEFLRSRPAVELNVVFTDRYVVSRDKMRKVVAVSIRNTGREDTRLLSLLVRGERFMLNGLNLLLPLDQGGNIEPPTSGGAVISGYSSQTFIINAEIASEDVVRVSADFGHGVSVEDTATLNEARHSEKSEPKKSRFRRRPKD